MSDLDPTVASALLNWFNFIGGQDECRLLRVPRLEDLWQRHIPIFIALLERKTVGQAVAPSNALSVFEAVIRWLRSTEDEKYIDSLDAQAAAAGDKWEIAKFLVVLSQEMTIGCGSMMEQLLNKMDKELDEGGCSMVFTQLLAELMQMSSSGAISNTQWMELLSSTDCTDSPGEQFDAAQDVPIVGSPIVSADPRRSTISGGVSCVSNQSTTSTAILNNSTYFTPVANRTLRRQLTARTPTAPTTSMATGKPSSPSAALQDLLSSPMMKEKRAARELKEKDKKIIELNYSVESQATDIARLKEVLFQMEGKYSSMKTELSETKNGLKFHTELLEEKETRIQELIRQTNEAEDAVEEKKALLAKANKTIGELERQRDVETAERERVERKWEAERKSLTRQYQDANDVLVNLQEKLRSAEEAARGQMDEQEYVTMLNEMRTSHREALKAKEEEYLNFTSELQMVSARLNRKLMEMEEELESEKKSKECQMQLITVLRNEQKQADEEMEKVRGQMDQLKKTMQKEREETEERIDSHRQSLQKLQTELAAVRNGKEEMEALLSDCKKKLAGEKEEKEVVQTAMEELKKRNEDLELVINRDLQLFANAQEEMKVKITKMTDDLAESTALLETTCAEKSKVEEELAQLQKQFADSKEEYEKLLDFSKSKSKEILDQYNEKVEELNKQMTNKTREYEAQTEKLTREYGAEMAEKTREYEEQIAEKTKEYEAQIEEKTKECGALRLAAADVSKLREIEEKNERLEREKRDQRMQSDEYIQTLKRKLEEEKEKCASLTREKEKWEDKLMAEGVNEVTLDTSSTNGRRLSDGSGRGGAGRSRRTPMDSVDEEYDNVDCEDEPDAVMTSKLLDGTYKDVDAVVHRTESGHTVSSNTEQSSNGGPLRGYGSNGRSVNSGPLRVPSQSSGLGRAGNSRNSMVNDENSQSTMNFPESVQRDVNYGKDSLARVKELHARNQKVAPNLRCSYAVETSTMSPIFKEDDMRNAKEFEPIKPEKIAMKLDDDKETASNNGSASRSSKGRRSGVMDRMKSFMPGSATKKKGVLKETGNQ